MKPTVPEVLPLVKKLYERHGSGCCLHVVLDDQNVHDNHVQYSIECAKQRNHDDCLRLGEILIQMSKTQRIKLSRLR